MAISGVTESVLIQPDGAVGQKDLDRDDFMTLFITQLQHQDPMKPMDSSEMASQLAEFSNMEATMKMSDNIEKLLEYQTSQNNLQITRLLGTQVMVSGNMMGVVDGESTPAEFILHEQAESLKLEIYDAADRLIWQDDMGSQGSGIYELDWDGNNMAGDPVPDGAYRYVVQAFNVEGHLIDDVEYRSSGKVTGVTFDGAAAKLTLNDFIEVAVDEVIKVQ